uniref:Uncharacterized protein n=1 Tax=Oryza glaberrima TaxID=4538 RepID=I1QAS2_ORYGL
MATNNGGEEMKVESGVVGEVGGEEERKKGVAQRRRRRCGRCLVGE